MAVSCQNPSRDKHEIPDGGRRLEIKPLTIDWGSSDLRDGWQGDYTFCSFACLSEWAAARAAEHDEHVLVDGEPPEGDEPA